MMSQSAKLVAGIPRFKAAAGAAAVALGMGLFGLLLELSGCVSCSTMLPPSVIFAGAVGWCVVMTLATFGFEAAAACGAFGMLGSHAAVIVLGPRNACPSCWLFLLAELAVCLALLGEWPLTRSSSPRAEESPGAMRLRSAGKALLAVLLLLVGFGGSVVMDAVLASPPRVIGGSGQGGELHDEASVVSIIIRPGCGRCPIAEEKMTQAIERGLEVTAVVLEASSSEGRKMVDSYNLERFPSFVAARNRQIDLVQQGGRVETFIRAVREQEHRTVSGNRASAAR